MVCSDWLMSIPARIAHRSAYDNLVWCEFTGIGLIVRSGVPNERQQNVLHQKIGFPKGSRFFPGTVLGKTNQPAVLLF